MMVIGNGREERFLLSSVSFYKHGAFVPPEAMSDSHSNRSVYIVFFRPFFCGRSWCNDRVGDVLQRKRSTGSCVSLHSRELWRVFMASFFFRCLFSSSLFFRVIRASIKKGK